ncbi:MAG TPA: DUF3592 domain-containing protein [Catenuloplanes sp.]|jgi:hypothetical protein
MKDKGDPGADREIGLHGEPLWVAPVLAHVIALVAWWYFGATAVEAYHFATAGVVVSGQVSDKRGGRMVEYTDVRFTTADGRQVETTAAPKWCEAKEPGDPVKVRYLPRDPHMVQDTCDPPAAQASVLALLVAAGSTAASGLVWRGWWQVRRSASARG